jgi:hypothetical protein
MVEGGFPFLISRLHGRLDSSLSVFPLLHQTVYIPILPAFGSRAG